MSPNLEEFFGQRIILKITEDRELTSEINPFPQRLLASKLLVIIRLTEMKFIMEEAFDSAYSSTHIIHVIAQSSFLYRQSAYSFIIIPHLFCQLVDHMVD